MQQAKIQRTLKEAKLKSLRKYISNLNSTTKSKKLSQLQKKQLMFNSNNSENCNIPFFFHELKDAVKKIMQHSCWTR